MHTMTFDDFIGNDHAKDTLRLFVEAANKGQRIPHIGIFGPTGQGKTTLAQILASTTNRNFCYVNSVAVKRPTTLRGIITHPENLACGAIIALDECHRLPPSIQDNLLSALEYPSVLITAEKDQIIRDYLHDNISFVLCTTHQGLLRDALLNRLEHIDVYENTTEEKQIIAANYLVKRKGLPGTNIDVSAILEIGRRSRSGRHVIKTCDNIIRYMENVASSKLDATTVDSVYRVLDIDVNGLTARDKQLLRYLQDKGSVGLATLEAVLNMPKKDILEKIEPFLLRRALIVRQSIGRTITERGAAALRGERLSV